MRSLLCVMLGLSLTGIVSAQAPGQQPPAMTPEQQMELDHILTKWETDAKSLKALFVAFLIEEKDPTFGGVTKSYGEAKVLQLANGQYGLKLEVFDLNAAGQPDMSKLRRKYVCSGTWLYEYDVSSKTISVKQLQSNAARPDDGPFAFLFGMKANDAKRRFAMSIVKKDDHYTWLRIEPLTEQDQKDFKVAQLGLVNYDNAISPKHFPIRIMWRENGNKDLSWEFKAVVRNDLNRVSVADFNVENDKKAGWKIVQAPPQNRPLQGTPTGGGTLPRK
jgi:TIGR03009 family protein